MPNSPKTQTAWGTVEPVPLASGSAAPAPAGPSLFNRVAGTFKTAQNALRGVTGAAAARMRAAQGKAPASEVRETVKFILRIFVDRKEWSKLTEVRPVSEAALAKVLAIPEKARTATDNIYQMILETFGAYMSQTVLTVISMPISNQINLINNDIRSLAHTFYDAQSRYEKIRGQIDNYAAKNAVNREANNKIGELVKLAWFNINQLFREREASFVSARVFLNLQPKNRGAQVAAQQAMQAAAPPPLEISQAEINIGKMTKENWQQIQAQRESAKVEAELDGMTEANWKKVQEEQIKTLIEQGKLIPNSLVYPQPPMFSKAGGLGRRSRKDKRRANKTRRRSY